MPERGLTLGLTLCGLRLCVLRSFVWVVVAAGAVSTGAVLPVEACTFKPRGPAPRGAHWYYMVDGGKRCWYLGPRGLAVHRSATRRLRHRAAVAHERPAAKKIAAARPPAAPAMPQATEAGLGAAVNGAEALAPALPPPEASGVSELAAEPAQQGSADEAQSPDAIEAQSPDAIAPAPAALPAPETKPTEAPQLAAPARPERAVAASDHNHTFASIVVAAALLVIAGPLLWAARRRNGRKARAATPSAPPVRSAPVGALTPLVWERTAVRRRRPAGARGQATEEVGSPRLPDDGDAARGSRRAIK